MLYNDDETWKCRTTLSNAKNETEYIDTVKLQSRL